MKSKLKFIIPIVLIAGFAAYKFVLAKPPPAVPKKVDGAVYVMPKDFLINLADSRFAKLNVGLVLAPGFVAAPPAAEGAAVTPPDGYGAMEQEAVVRDIVTNTITGDDATVLTSAAGRKKIKAEILRQIQKTTDVKATRVLLMDVAVQ
ncbi:MAG: flagellar basal body-associated FliL family protein [Solirubrobacteraceae bacterium]